MHLVIRYPEIDLTIQSYRFEIQFDLRSDFRVDHEHEKNDDFHRFREHQKFISKLIL